MQTRKRAHHRELQLSNYHVRNFQFRTFGSCVFLGVVGGGGSSDCKATRFLQRIFLFLGEFTSSVFQTVREQMSDNNQTD